MTGPDAEPTVPQYLRQTRIVVGALVMGVMIFAVIDLVQWSSGRVPMNPGFEMISYMAAGFAAMMLVMRPFIVRAITAAPRKKLMSSEITLKRLFEVHTTQTIVGAALIEGPAFFLLIAFLLAGQWWTWVAGLAFGALIGILHFPTLQRIEDWLVATRDELQQAKAEGR